MAEPTQPASKPSVALDYQGVKYTFGEFDSLKDFAAVETYLQSLKAQPIDAILPELEKLKAFPHLQEKLLSKAYDDLLWIKGDKRKRMPQEEVVDFLKSLDGLVYVMWFLIHKNHPDVTLEMVEKMISSVGQDVAQKKIEESIKNAA